jgi:predicted nucleotide-binding protein
MPNLNTSSNQTSTRASLVIPHQEAKDRIQEAIRKGEAINNASERTEWLMYIRELLRRLVDNDELLDQFNNDFNVTEAYENNKQLIVRKATTLLRAISGKLDLIPEQSITYHKESKQIKPIGNKVFIVHGHNEGIRESSARLIEKLNLVPIILRDLPNQGKTIIEKISDYSDVSYAIILLTGDDRGGTKDEEYQNQRVRPRQNVILELGYFIGKLGRENVCALYEENVEIPSDYQGVLYIPLDKSGVWKLLLAKEMKAANLPVDMNLL